MTRPSQRPGMLGALELNELLRPRSVPLPRVLAADLDGDYPTLALERLAGNDLEHVADNLDERKLEMIAGRVAAAQSVVASLPAGTRYGYAVRENTALYASWSEFLGSSLARSRLRLSETGLFSLLCADRIEALLGAVDFLARDIEATPFLHDTTFRNVIVTSDGAFSGIVDVDDLCWGDPRFAPALTLAVAEAYGQPRYYVESWMRAARFRDDRLFRAYVALLALDLLSELGTKFNGNEVAADSATRLQVLTAFERASQTAETTSVR